MQSQPDGKMSPEPVVPVSGENRPAQNPPLLLAATPSAGDNPSLPPKVGGNAASARGWLALLLSVGVAAFLADAFVSLADTSLMYFFDIRSLAGIRAIVFCFTMVLACVIYGLMAITPMIPKRYFLPLTLFNPGVVLLLLPLLIYFYARMPLIAWLVSIFQVAFAMGLLLRLQGKLKPGWPLVPTSLLTGRGFSWRNSFVFLAVNLFILLPVVAVYLILSAKLGLSHATDGFMALRREGLAVQVRKYIRNDGKTVELFPMSHVADSAFFRRVTESFPSNAVVLMEGVTDEHNLLTNEISYDRMAKSLGVAEQHEEFRPVTGEWVPADVDVGQFSSNTIAFLNLVMRLHSKGLTPENMLTVTQYTPPPHFEEQLWDDLLVKRNEHVLQEMNSRLATSDYIVIPWGAAHMAGLSKEIQKAGFRLAETQEFLAIRFRFWGSKLHEPERQHLKAK